MKPSKSVQKRNGMKLQQIIFLKMDGGERQLDPSMTTYEGVAASGDCKVFCETCFSFYCCIDLKWIQSQL